MEEREIKALTPQEVEMRIFGYLDDSPHGSWKREVIDVVAQIQLRSRQKLLISDFKLVQRDMLLNAARLVKLIRANL